jgi:hypothetical protein
LSCSVSVTLSNSQRNFFCPTRRSEVNVKTERILTDNAGTEIWFSRDGDLIIDSPRGHVVINKHDLPEFLAFASVGSRNAD